VAFSPDGKSVASGCQDQTIKIWDTATGKETASWTAHDGAVYLLRFADDGKTLVSGDRENTVRMWDTGTWKERGSLKVDEGAIHALGQAGPILLAAGTGPMGPRCWNITRRTVIPGTDGPGDTSRPMALSPGGRMFAMVVLSNTPERNRIPPTHTVRVLEIVSGRERAAITHRGRVDSLAFSPDCRTLALAGGPVGETGSGAPRFVTLRDLSNERDLFTLEGHRTGIEVMAFSPDGRLLATGGADGVLKLWEVATGKEQQFPGCRVDGLTSLDFSPDGRILAVGSYLGPVRLFDVKSVNGKER
jgi:WD40 repeat protein